MNQLEMELKFSKNFRDLIIIDDVISDCGSVMSELYLTIDTWREDDFYPMKQELVDRLPCTQDIVVELMLTMVSKHHEHLIQGSAVELGSRLGYRDTIESAKIGSSILSICHGTLFDIMLRPDGIWLQPLLSIDMELRRKLKELTYLPPNLVAPSWTSNHGGWAWEKKSVILGKGNHHNETQALDVLNKLQSVAWTIDTEVLVSEQHHNQTHNEMEIVGHYVGEQMYFTHQFDKRGRIYSSGYQINPQADEYQKAILTPTTGEKCTEQGLSALKIDIANYMGMDKLTWDERISSINFYLNNGVFGSIYGDDSAWKKPMLGRKTLRAYESAMRGEVVNHFVELDATSSCFQIMACLSGCVTTGRTCNLVKTGKRENAYQHIHDAMGEVCNCEGIETKYPSMTFFYGSKAVPRAAFNDEQLEAFYEVIATVLPGCNAIMNLLANYWNSDVLYHKFTMPDGHVVKVNVMAKEKIRIKVGELNDRSFSLEYNKNQPSTNHVTIYSMVVHAVDAWVCRELVRRCDFEMSTIHKQNCGLM